MTSNRNMAVKTETNPLSKVCREYLAACSTFGLSDEARTISLDPVLDTLPLVIRRPGLVYEAMTPACMGMGGECLCYARPETMPPFAETNPNPFEGLPEPYLHLDKALDWTFTPEGMWQWFLMEDMWRNLPLFWHAGYSRIQYVLDQKDYRHTLPFLESYLTPTGRPRKGYKEEINTWAETLDKYHGSCMLGYHSMENYLTAIELAKDADKTVPPSAVQVDGRTIDVTFCAWNAWVGLKEIRLRMDLTRRTGIRMTQTQDKVLVKYDCGIRF